jgi:hypothetical protein
MENDYRKKIRGFANEVDQRAQNRENFELGFLVDKLKLGEEDKKEIIDLFKTQKEQFARESF